MSPNAIGVTLCNQYPPAAIVSIRNACNRVIELTRSRSVGLGFTARRRDPVSAIAVGYRDAITINLWSSRGRCREWTRADPSSPSLVSCFRRKRLVDTLMAWNVGDCNGVRIAEKWWQNETHETRVRGTRRKDRDVAKYWKNVCSKGIRNYRMKCQRRNAPWWKRLKRFAHWRGWDVHRAGVQFLRHGPPTKDESFGERFLATTVADVHDGSDFTFCWFPFVVLVFVFW